MKTFKFITVGVLFTLSYFYSSAQQERIPVNQPNYNQPRLFEDVPQKVDLRITDMETLFDYPVGSSVSAKFSKGFYLQGTVVSKSDDASVKYLVIKSVNRRDAVFTFTKIINKDGSFTYKGRILSKNNSDAFEVVKENGQYFLQKKNYNEMVTE
jgi:hypothetical protein